MEHSRESVAALNEAYVEEVLNDYYLAVLSREASLLGRKEVLTGKAKFGIFGDGKELAQLALAKQFKDGDFRSGYYRDQTLMMAIGALNVQELFANLYAHPDLSADPSSAGRQMVGHFATRNIDENGKWKDLTAQKNSSADISPTAGQMPRLLGLAQASKIFRQNEALHSFPQFSKKGNEVAFGTIGDASTSEGLFWETFNAAGVLDVPMVLSVWDDGYGISVPKKYQTTKSDISAVLKGFQREKNSNGFEIFKVKGWDYPALCATYEQAVKISRENHIPVLIHVDEITQPQGHSTSGSHERYKSKERLEWAKAYDCNAKFRQWILDFDNNGAQIATAEELDEIAARAKKDAKNAQKAAWNAFNDSINNDLKTAVELMNKLAAVSENGSFIMKESEELTNAFQPIRKDILSIVRKSLRWAAHENSSEKQDLVNWLKKVQEESTARYSSFLYSESSENIDQLSAAPPQYEGEEEQVDGRIVLRENFDAIFQNNPLVLTFGEDTGQIGGVNQSMEGMQKKYGKLRVDDTGIREATIIGQAIGMAMRGLRPIAEIQYLDYLFYALQILSDDLATVQYRTKGGQKAPVIIRTRGHRLEGIWHSGSPMGTLVHALRGIRICVPRNMTEAAGFYNALLASDEPGLVIEPLNGYRIKEKLPSNLGEFKTPFGVPEIVKKGTDITVVSYGSTFNLCSTAAEQLENVGISCELVDVRTLLPFDTEHLIAQSIQKTSRVLFVDEDVPGGATAYMMQKVLEEQGAYYALDSLPATLTAKDHRPAYGSDGDYFSKPNVEDIFEKVYAIMSEANPEKYPALY